MVLSRKRLECLLQVRSEVLVEDLGVLFSSEGRMEQGIDRRIIAVSVVVQTLYRSVMVKRELSQKGRLSVYRSIFVPILTDVTNCG